MEEDKGSEEAENWKVYEALCSKTPTEVLTYYHCFV